MKVARLLAVCAVPFLCAVYAAPADANRVLVIEAKVTRKGKPRARQTASARARRTADRIRVVAAQNRLAGAQKMAGGEPIGKEIPILGGVRGNVTIAGLQLTVGGNHDAGRTHPWIRYRGPVTGAAQTIAVLALAGLMGDGTPAAELHELFAPKDVELGTPAMGAFLRSGVLFGGGKRSAAVDNLAGQRGTGRLRELVNDGQGSFLGRDENHNVIAGTPFPLGAVETIDLAKHTLELHVFEEEH
jgi:hypothetical protein